MLDCLSCHIICIGVSFTSELLHAWVLSSGKTVEALSSPGGGRVCSQPCTTLINAQSKSRFGFFLWRVGTSDILLDAVRFGFASRPPSSVDRSTSKRSLSVTSVSVHYTIDLGSTNFSNSQPLDSSPTLVLISHRPAPPRPRYRPLSALHRPDANTNSLHKVCIFQHVVYSFAPPIDCDCDAIFMALCMPLCRHVQCHQSIYFCHETIILRRILAASPSISLPVQTQFFFICIT